jgi:hypothetical protein
MDMEATVKGMIVEIDVQLYAEREAPAGPHDSVSAEAQAAKLSCCRVSQR